MADDTREQVAVTVTDMVWMKQGMGRLEDSVSNINTKVDGIREDVNNLKIDIAIGKKNDQEIKELKEQIEANRKMITQLQITWAKLLGAMVAGGAVGSGVVEVVKGML